MNGIFFHPYSLKPKASLNQRTTQSLRHGVLLKKDGGYADLFPWSELGDANVETHLKELREGRTTALMQQSLALADRDADFRRRGVSMAEAACKVKNHRTVTDLLQLNEAKLHEWQSQGFTTLKIKVGRDWPAEQQKLQQLFQKVSKFRLRLDFNAQGELKTFVSRMESLSAIVRDQIEFVEDPFPFSVKGWTAASQLVKLAMDNEHSKFSWKEAPPFQYLVIKPARQNVAVATERAQAQGLQVIFTSAMDHPVGVMHAAAIAGEYQSQHPEQISDAGLLTSDLYEPSAFHLSANAAHLNPEPGVGVGFDQILKDLAWQPI